MKIKQDHKELKETHYDNSDKYSDNDILNNNYFEGMLKELEDKK